LTDEGIKLAKRAKSNLAVDVLDFEEQAKDDDSV